MSSTLSPQEQAVHALFLRKAQRTLAELGSIYNNGLVPIRPEHALTAIIRSLNRKLGVARKGKIERISPRGRGYVGVYKLKRR